jgi:hypothetical protein
MPEKDCRFILSNVAEWAEQIVPVQDYVEVILLAVEPASLRQCRLSLIRF